jgi:hypothetical protein
LTRAAFPRERRDQLVQVWKRWNLNGMRAGCEHQTYEVSARAANRSVGKACSTCGAEWLFEEMPEHILEFLRPLAGTVVAGQTTAL